MVERDRFERRGYAATVPDDADDPAQFGQPKETAKDAVVLELRKFFDQPDLQTQDPERRREIPTVRKYAVGFGPGTDPYETTQQIIQDWADLGESLPHCAVTAVTGMNNRLTAGQPFIAHVQHPPRVESDNAEPYALLASAREKWTVVVDTAVVGFRYSIVLNDQDFAYVAVVGDTTRTVAAGLRDVLRGTESLVRVQRIGSTLTITAAEDNVAFTLTASSNMTAAQVTAAGTADTDALTFRTTPDCLNAEEETVTFHARRFPAANPPSAALAADVARIFNEQARGARAEVIPVGAGDGLRFLTGGKIGKKTPNEIEIVSTTSANLLAALGLGSAGVGGALDSITGTPPDTSMTLSTPGVGTAATAATGPNVDPFIVIGGVLTGSNNGRFKVTNIVDPDTVEYDNPAGSAASFTDATWFIGKRDTWKNTDRPMMNRRHMSFKLTISVSILAESPNEAQELSDLVLAEFSYYMEEKYYNILGRGVLSEDYPDENYQLSVGQEIAPAGQSTVARPGDSKGYVYEERVSLPVTLFMYQDRAVLVPFGPHAGEPFVLDRDGVQPADQPVNIYD